jgi:glycosyltransferase involved in cell wall biosynthesis
VRSLRGPTLRSRPNRRRRGDSPVLVHVTTVDLSLAYLLLPQLVAFREAGYDVIGVSAPGPHVARLTEHGIRHLALVNSTRARDLKADAAAAREFLRLCRRLQPDIVHTHNPKPGVYGRIGAGLAHVPVVVNTVHGLYAQPTDRWRKRAAVYGLERLAASFSDAELVQNPEDVPVMKRLGIAPRKLYLLGNGIDLDRFDPERHGGARTQARADLGIAEREVLVGLVGRLVAEKGYREVFEAARRLRETHPNVRFVVAGPSEFDKADAIGQDELDRVVDEGVHILGMHREIERLYPAMDLFVLASHREGFPRSAMEAAAMGLPMVMTDIRGGRQVVDHRLTGLLVPPRDPDALAAAITRLADDPALRQRMGLAARAKALREFDFRRQVELTLTVYANLLSRDLGYGRAPRR